MYTDKYCNLFMLGFARVKWIDGNQKSHLHTKYFMQTCKG